MFPIIFFPPFSSLFCLDIPIVFLMSVCLRDHATYSQCWLFWDTDPVTLEKAQHGIITKRMPKQSTGRGKAHGGAGPQAGNHVRCRRKRRGGGHTLTHRWKAHWMF